MQHISVPEFVAATSEAGGLGILSSASFQDLDAFREALRDVKRLTGKPFAVNLNFFPAINPTDNNLYANIMIEEGGVTAVESSGQRPPQDMVARLREGGIKVMHKCVSVRHALSALKSGIDAVTLFGQEGGGHIGGYGISTMALVPAAVDALDVPVIAAGGIGDGRGLAAALALGASGVIMGTRLLLTQECPIHPAIKQALLDASEMDTLSILGSVHNPLRAWRNAASSKVAELEERGASLEEILTVVGGAYTREMLRSGDPQSGVIACSQCVGIMNDIKPLRELFNEIVTDAEAILHRLAG